MSEKVASHSGVTRHNDIASSGTSQASSSGRLIANRVFVGNIPSNLVERDLIMLFHRFGKIRDVKIIPEHTRNKSYGFVTFFSEVDARRAIQASVQHDCVMWGDRKLNVAPAVKRSNSSNQHSSPTNSNGFYQSPRVNSNNNNAYYPATIPLPAGNVYSNSTAISTQEVHQQQAVEAIPVDPNSNPMYQTAVICRLPHQYAMTQCHQYSSSTSGHYFVAPGFQPYIQAGSPAPTNNPAPHYASYANLTSFPLTPPCSTTSRDNSVVTEIPSDVCVESSGGDSVVSSQGDGEKNAETVGNEANCEAGQMHQVPSGNNDSPYPLHTTIMCCPHHSCMLSPISPIQHLPSQAVAATGLARSCISLHGYPAANCSYPPNSPLIYSSPIVYNTARRSSSARLQRWNSLDANLTGLSHGHQPNGVWGNEAAWSRPSLLDDSYGSEAGLYPGPRGCERALRPGFSCQSHHGGMFSPFCRSYEYNIWGQGQNPNQGSVEHLDSTGSPSASSLQIGMAAQSTSSLALNINESTGDQTPQNKK